MKNIIPTETSDQIKSLNIKTNIPLIISDADEVLFLFLKGFEKFLKSKNLYLDLAKARLTGNIKKISDNTPVPDDTMSKLLPEFFLKETKKLEPVIDAENCLKSLSKKTQIIILTNIPFKDKKSRVDALKKYNMNYPVITNSGLKGAGCFKNLRRNESSCFFY
jgi:hypothetical protein